MRRDLYVLNGEHSRFFLRLPRCDADNRLSPWCGGFAARQNADTAGENGNAETAHRIFSAGFALGLGLGLFRIACCAGSTTAGRAAGAVLGRRRSPALRRRCWTSCPPPASGCCWGRCWRSTALRWAGWAFCLPGAHHGYEHRAAKPAGFSDDGVPQVRALITRDLQQGLALLLTGWYRRWGLFDITPQTPEAGTPRGHRAERAGHLAGRSSVCLLARRILHHTAWPSRRARAFCPLRSGLPAFILIPVPALRATGAAVLTDHRSQMPARCALPCWSWELRPSRATR